MSEEDLKEAKALRSRERNFESALTFIIRYSLFISLLCIVTYGNRSSQSFYFYDNIRKLLDVPDAKVFFSLARFSPT